MATKLRAMSDTGFAAGQAVARGEFGLAGQEAEPRGAGIPRVDDGRAGDEVVQGAVLPLHEDAEKPQPAEQEAEREGQRVPRPEPPESRLLAERYNALGIGKLQPGSARRR